MKKLEFDKKLTAISLSYLVDAAKHYERQRAKIRWPGLEMTVKGFKEHLKKEENPKRAKITRVRKPRKRRTLPTAARSVRKRLS